MNIDPMRIAADIPRQTALAYAQRWEEWSPLCLLMMGVDRSTERYQGFRQRHWDRLLLLNQSLNIPMKIITRRQLDDPRITEPEMRKRLAEYRITRDKVNPWKNRKGGKQ